MRVDVTAEDIQKGIPRAGTCCPVALALRRVTGQTWDVGRFSIFPGSGASWENRIPAPDAVFEFVAAFDWGDSVEPMSFEFPWEPNR